MPALSTFVLNNNAAVAKTFSIESSGNNNQGLFVWRQRATAVPVRYEAITYSNKRGRGSNLLVHHFKLVKPVTFTDYQGVERQQSQMMADVRMYMPDNAINADRLDFLAFYKNLAAHSSMSAVIVDGESYY